MLLAAFEQGIEEQPHAFDERANFLPQKKLDIDQHLVVARSAGVQLPARVAEATGEFEFHLRMHVLHLRFDDEAPADGVRMQRAQFALQVLRLVGSEELDRGKHAHMRDAAQHVERRELSIEAAVATRGEFVDAPRGIAGRPGGGPEFHVNPPSVSRRSRNAI